MVTGVEKIVLGGAAMKSDRCNGRAGVTLIELMVVVAIIAIIAVIGVALFTSAKYKAFTAEAYSVFSEIITAEKAHFAINNTFLNDAGDATNKKLPALGVAYDQTKNFTYVVSAADANGFTVTATVTAAGVTDNGLKTGGTIKLIYLKTSPPDQDDMQVDITP
jgi:prepilin-type N-terminal cleavage/methylation domain-containing protein